MPTEHDYMAREYKRGYEMNKMNISSPSSEKGKDVEDDSIQRATVEHGYKRENNSQDEISYSTGNLSLWETPRYALTLSPKSSRYHEHRHHDTRFLITFDEPSTTVVERIPSDDEVVFGSLGEAPLTPATAIAYAASMAIVLIIVSAITSFILPIGFILPMLIVMPIMVLAPWVKESIASEIAGNKGIVPRQLPVQEDYLCVEEISGRRIIRLLKTVKNDSMFTQTVISKLKTVKTNRDLIYWLIAVEKIIDLDETFPMDGFPVITSDLEDIRDALIAKDEARKAQLQEIEDARKREQDEIRQVEQDYEEKFAIEDSVTAKRNGLAHIELL